MPEEWTGGVVVVVVLAYPPPDDDDNKSIFIIFSRVGQCRSRRVVYSSESGGRETR